MLEWVQDYHVVLLALTAESVKGIGILITEVSTFKAWSYHLSVAELYSVYSVEYIRSVQLLNKSRGFMGAVSLESEHPSTCINDFKDTEEDSVNQSVSRPVVGLLGLESFENNLENRSCDNFSGDAISAFLQGG